MKSVKPAKKLTEPVRINESQLADTADNVGSRKREIKSGVMDDVGLWDEIYGVTSDKKDSSLNIYDPNPAPKVPKPSVKELAKTIGRETLKDNKLSTKQHPDSAGRVVNISDDGDLTISVTPEKKRKSSLLMSPGDLEIDLTGSQKKLRLLKM